MPTIPTNEETPPLVETEQVAVAFVTGTQVHVSEKGEAVVGDKLASATATDSDRDDVLSKIGDVEGKPLTVTAKGGREIDTVVLSHCDAIRIGQRKGT